ncbi:hypothetical protein LUZ60_013183 [Juncus effusus]|nr:hypothetical protein LUZ60_013183 [Juncus effusus]
MQEAIYDQNEVMNLPPGFRFHPSDEEIITHYLSPKFMNRSFNPIAMGEVDLNKCEPWDLPTKAKMGEKEWWFFCQRDRKYPTGTRTNRATESGYWKATGKDKEIFRGKGVLVGMKKTLVFYLGRAPRGEKSNWVMHEFRLDGKLPFSNLSKSAKDEWVVCRVFHKNGGMEKRTPVEPGLERIDSFVNGLLDSSLPPLMDPQDYPHQGIYIPGMTFDPQLAGASYQDPVHNGYMNHEDAIRRHCKAEQSNQSVLSFSRETGLSDHADRNAEISSVVNRQQQQFGELNEDDALIDIDNIWTF